MGTDVIGEESKKDTRITSPKREGRMSRRQWFSGQSNGPSDIITSHRKLIITQRNRFDSFTPPNHAISLHTWGPLEPILVGIYYLSKPWEELSHTTRRIQCPFVRCQFRTRDANVDGPNHRIMVGMGAPTWRFGAFWRGISIARFLDRKQHCLGQFEFQTKPVHHGSDPYKTRKVTHVLVYSQRTPLQIVWRTIVSRRYRGCFWLGESPAICTRRIQGERTLRYPRSSVAQWRLLQISGSVQEGVFDESVLSRVLSFFNHDHFVPNLS